MNIHRIYAAVGHRFRSQRMQECADALQLTRDTRVLDVGGTWHNWWLLPDARRPRLTLLNLGPRPDNLPPHVDWVQGSALDIPAQPGDYDVVFSNSVIEHVGDWKAQQRYADEVRRLNCPYWVQTPNRRFLVEPHFLGLGVQYLPPRIARVYARYGTIWGWAQRPSRATVEAVLREIRLLTDGEVRTLFPGAELRRERVGPFTKSLIALKPVCTSSPASPRLGESRAC